MKQTVTIFYWEKYCYFPESSKIGHHKTLKHNTVFNLRFSQLLYLKRQNLGYGKNRRPETGILGLAPVLPLHRSFRPVGLSFIFHKTRCLPRHRFYKLAFLYLFDRNSLYTCGSQFSARQGSQIANKTCITLCPHGSYIV